MIAFFAGVVAHAASLWNGFVFDDGRAIVGNPVVSGSFAVARFFGTDFWGTAGEVGTYRPLPVMSFWVDWRLGQGTAWPFHAGNVVAHGFMSALLAVALRRQVSPRAAWSAVLFAVLAVNTEAVASAVGRADVWAGLGVMAAWAVLDTPTANRPHWRAAGAAVLFLAALFCKETAGAFLVWLVVTDRVLHAVPVRWSRYVLPSLGLLVYIAVRLAVFGSHPVAISAFNNPLVGAPLVTRLWTAFELLTMAVRLELLPFNLSPEYGAPEILPAHFSSLSVWLGLALAVMLVAAAMRLRRREFTAGLVIFAVSFGVVSNGLVVLPTIFAERLLYLPSVGAALMLGCVRRRWLLLPLMILQLALGIAHDRAWHDRLSLFTVAVEVSPRSARAWYNYASALQNLGRSDDAIAAARRASELAPAWARPHAALGSFLDERGAFEAARAEFQRAYGLEREDPEVVRDVAIFFARHGGRADAQKIVDAYLRNHPTSELRHLIQ